MTSPLKKYILPAFLLPSAVFAISTLPLAMLSTQQVAIDLQEETVFTGQLRDIATPYLAAATAVSVTVGIAGVAVTGWKQSKNKSSELEAQLQEQQNALKKKEEQIEELKLSPSVLEAAGLESFLEENRPELQPVMVTAMAEPLPEISVQIEEVPESKPEPQPEPPQLHVLQFPKAAVTPAQPSGMDEIQTRLQQLQTQLETLQKAVSSEPQSTTFQLKVPDMRQIVSQHKIAV
jgi:flagellar biosynthesis chaperone FliJ